MLPAGPHSHPWVHTWSSIGLQCYSQVTPVPQMGPYCLTKVTSLVPQCHHLGPQFHLHVMWVPSSTPVSPVGYHGYPQANHCPSSHGYMSPYVLNTSPLPSPGHSCSQQFFTAIPVSSSSFTMTLPPLHVSTCPLLVPAKSLCGLSLPNLPCSPMSPQVAGVLQCPSLLSRSLSANITLGWGHKEGTQVMAAARRVGVHAWAKQLLHGYDTGTASIPMVPLWGLQCVPKMS